MAAILTPEGREADRRRMAPMSTSAVPSVFVSDQPLRSMKTRMGPAVRIWPSQESVPRDNPPDQVEEPRFRTAVGVDVMTPEPRMPQEAKRAVLKASLYLAGTVTASPPFLDAHRLAVCGI